MEIERNVSEEELAIFPEVTSYTGCPKPTLQQTAGENRTEAKSALHLDTTQPDNSPTLPSKDQKPTLYTFTDKTEQTQCNIIQTKLKRHNIRSKPGTKGTVEEQPENDTRTGDRRASHFRLPSPNYDGKQRPHQRPVSARHFRLLRRLRRPHY